MSVTRRMALLLGAATAAACGEPTAAPLPRLAVPVIRTVSGNAQTGTAGEMLPEPVVVSLTDGTGKPVSGWTVTFQVTAGGGSVAESRTTSAGGTAEAPWTLGPAVADSQRVVARVTDPSVPYAAEVVFSATATPGPPANLEAVDGQILRESHLGYPVALTVHVTDRYGNPAAAMVEWTADAGGSMSAAQSPTDPQGNASSWWTLGPEVTTEQHAEAAVGPGLRVGFRGRRPVEYGAQLIPLSGDGQVGRFGTTLEKPLRVQLRNGDGSPVPHVALAWTVSGGTVEPSTSITDSAGEAEARWTLPPQGEELTAAVRHAASTQPWITFRAWGTRLKQVAHVPGEVRDADGERVLWVDSLTRRTVWLRDHGSDAMILAAAPGDVGEGYLYPAGALVVARTGNTSGVLYEWRDGRTASLGPIALPEPEVNLRGPAVKGQWAVWTDGTSLIRRDLAGGFNRTLAAFAVVGGFDVAANGTTVFGDGSITVVGGPLSGVLTPVYPNQYRWSLPRTDGVNVLAFSRDVDIFSQRYWQVVQLSANAWGRVLASWEIWPGPRNPDGYYQASGGWTAYRSPRSPSWRGFDLVRSGVNVETPSGEPAYLDLLAADGSLMIHTETRRYLVPVAGPAQYLSPLVPGRVVHAGGRFYLLSGGTVYEVSP
ncbi:MAG TPA: Ig-like domain-containing protein [Longimicrobium sp.]|nr:Ig-like domain-containing protein [Longimicrobium sp.]